MKRHQFLRFFLRGHVFGALCFATISLGAPPPPTINSPGSTTSPGPVESDLTPTFTWNQVAGATGYALYIRDLTTNTLIFNNNGGAKTGTSYTLPSGYLSNNGHAFRWAMASIDSTGESGQSSYRYFQTPSTVTVPPPPTINSPGDTTSPGPVESDLTPTFTWNQVNGATGYALYIRDLTTNTLIFNNDGGAKTGTSYTLPSGYLSNNGHAFRWAMASVNSAGESGQSSYRYFQTPSTVTVPPPPTINSPGTTTSPGPVESDLTPTFTWNQVNGATGYALYIRDLTTNTLIFNNDGGPKTGTSFTLPSGYLSNNGHAFRWAMASINSAGESGQSSYRYFQTPSETGTPPLSITTTAFNPSTATVGIGYAAQSAVTATGGQTPYSWSASGFPNGMSINSSNGAPFGTPTVAGTFNVTVTVQDSSNPQKTASKTLTLTVSNTNTSPLSITTTAFNPSTATVGIGYAAQSAVTATGGRTPYVWSATGLPNGMAISSSSGAVFGTPTLAGTFSVDVTVRDSSSPQQTASKTLVLVVNVPTASPPATPNNPQPGSPTSPGPTMSSNSVTLNWSASPGADYYGIAVREISTSALVVDTTTSGTSYAVNGLTPGATYRWNVAAFNSAGNSRYTTPLYFQTPSQGVTVTVTGPDGGETWVPGIPQTISWSVIGDTSEIASFFISYSLDDGVTYANDVGIVRASGRSTSWTPPLIISSAAKGRIRVQARLASNSVLSEDVSNGAFNFDSVSATGMRFDRDVYFAQHEANFGQPSDDQRAAINTLLDFIENDAALPLDPAFKYLRWAAYMLATTRHETAKTYRPIEEYDGASRPYGPIYYGRGYVQLTHDYNYKKVDEALGYNVYQQPYLALEAPIAYKIMSYGMRNGLFTTVELSEYITDAGSDYFNARRIVNNIYENGTTIVAESIAAAAAQFETILRASIINTPSVATPAISPEGGTFAGGLQRNLSSSARGATGATTGDNGTTTTAAGAELVTISLACVTDGATIYYTTDGSTPTAASTEYTGPFIVSQSSTIRATAFSSGYSDGGVSSADFAFISTQLGNIATRMSVGTGDSAMIGGFIITGTEPKTVIIRGLGPSLAGFGIQAALSDPVIEVYDGSGVLRGTNDNWNDALTRPQIIDSNLAPTNDLESALWGVINPGAYTVVVRGKNDSTGVGLFEVYDLDRTVDSKLANISTRGFVNAGDDVMIGGTIVVGSTPTEVVVRAIGPSLVKFGISNALENPTLELRDANGGLIEENDNWRTAHEAEILAANLAPTDERESAILQTLSPGAYTAIVRGSGNSTGVALVEAYQLQ